MPRQAFSGVASGRVRFSNRSGAMNKAIVFSHASSCDVLNDMLYSVEPDDWLQSEKSIPMAKRCKNEL